MLLSAGNFAVYRTESNVFNVLEPRAGDLAKESNRRELLKLLRTYMELIARRQGVERWADCTPEHILYLERIQQTIPDALVIHVIRDGRDVALSTEKQKWIRPFFWDKGGELLAAAMFWEWMVFNGRQAGQRSRQHHRLWDRVPGRHRPAWP